MDRNRNALQLFNRNWGHIYSKPPAAFKIESKTSHVLQVSIVILDTDADKDSTESDSFTASD
jgi:hypothetical protein